MRALLALSAILLLGTYYVVVGCLVPNGDLPRLEYPIVGGFQITYRVLFGAGIACLFCIAFDMIYGCPVSIGGLMGWSIGTIVFVAISPKSSCEYVAANLTLLVVYILYKLLARKPVAGGT